MADTPLVPPTVIPPALDPLKASHDANQVEADFKAAVLEVFEAMIRPRAARINTYGMPHRGDFETVERFVKAEGLALERKSDKEAYMRELYRGWRARNPRRGTQFLRFYLQLLWPGEWVLNQLWHTPADTYPTGASSTPGASRILTSRLQLGLILTDAENVEPVIASLRAVLAARFVLDLTVLQRIGTAPLRMAAAMASAETQAFNWTATIADGAPAVPADPTIGATTAIGSTAATVNWTDNSTTETGFRVQFETPSGAGNWANAAGATNPTAVNVASFAATGLTAVTQYRPRVRAEGAGGVSGWAVGSAFTTASAVSAVRFYADGSSFVALSGSNKIATFTGSFAFGMAHVSSAAGGNSQATRTGKEYIEFAIGGDTTGTAIGLVANSNFSSGVPIGRNPFGESWPYMITSMFYSGINVGLIVAGSNIANSAYNYGPGDTIGVAVDWTTGKVWFSKNGTWIAGDPVAGTGQTFTVPSADFTFGMLAYARSGFTYTGQVRANSAEQTYAPPTGFSRYA